MKIGQVPRSLKFLLFICIFLLFSNGLAQYNVGQTVADFTLNDVYGNSHSLYNYQGNIILLNFFATW